jgi:hypothetical protein
MIHKSPSCRAIAGDGQDNVRINGRDAGVDDLEMRPGISRVQQGFEITTRAIGRLRVANRRGFS